MLLKTEGNKCPTKCKKDVSDGENVGKKVGKIFNRTSQMEIWREKQIRSYFDVRQVGKRYANTSTVTDMHVPR